MRCLTIIILVLLLVNFSQTGPLGGNDKVQEQGAKRGSDLTLSYAQSGTMIIALNSRTEASEQEQPDDDEEDKQKKTEKENDSPERDEKKPPLKDFEPSEKIDAEKAVDFPADI